MITRIMVAEDNTVDYSCYQSYFSKDTTINFVGHAQDGETAIKMYKEKNPDLLFLDLGLPKKNGLEVLDVIEKYDNENNVIIITGDAKLKSNISNTKKVYRIISKPIKYDSLERAITDFKKEQLHNSFPVQECQKILLQLNINPYARTGKILIDATHLSYSDMDLLGNMNIIYKIISKKYGCSPQKVKSSLRSSINTINRFQNDEILNKIFYLNNEKDIYTSPRRFISGFATYLNNR